MLAATWAQQNWEYNNFCCKINADSFNFRLASEFLELNLSWIIPTCFRRRKKGKGNRKDDNQDNRQSAVDTWQHNQHLHSFVSLEDKDNFEDYDNEIKPTFPDRIATQTVSYEFRNSWMTSSTACYCNYILYHIIFVTINLLLIC